MATLINNTEEEIKTAPETTDNTDAETSGETATPETTDEPTVITCRPTDYGSVMDALYMGKNGDKSMAKYRPLEFLLAMPYQESKAWVAKALDEYQKRFFKEGEPKSWPIARCLKVYVARKERRAKAKAS